MECGQGVLKLNPSRVWLVAIGGCGYSHWQKAPRPEDVIFLLASAEYLHEQSFL